VRDLGQKKRTCTKGGLGNVHKGEKNWGKSKELVRSGETPPARRESPHGEQGKKSVTIKGKGCPSERKKQEKGDTTVSPNEPHLERTGKGG